MVIGLFFGSFNPIHNGHLMLAQWMANFGGIDEVWFVVSPQNPFKADKTLAPAADRVEMVRLAVEGSPNLKVCDVELSMPIPSYTANTLDKLQKLHPTYEFAIIMGGDNVNGLTRWYRATDVLQHRILVYPRPNSTYTDIPNSRIELTNAPQIDISSTMLRQWISEEHNIAHFTPIPVMQYIEKKQLYKK